MGYELVHLHANRPTLLACILLNPHFHLPFQLEWPRALINAFKPLIRPELAEISTHAGFPDLPKLIDISADVRPIKAII